MDINKTIFEFHTNEGRKTVLKKTLFLIIVFFWSDILY